MRLAGQVKAGYFPAPPEAIAHVMSYIDPPADGGAVTIFDPCMGRGDAIKQFADAWNVPHENVYGAELDEGRGAAAVAAMPRANILQPADGTTIATGFNAFSFAWVNPPYDDEIGGGGRMEQTFLDTAARYVRAGGLLAIAMPESVAEGNIYIREALIARLDDPILIRYPPGFRKFNEVVVMGYVRASRRDMSKSPKWAALVKMEPRFGQVLRIRDEAGNEPRFSLKPGHKPKRFEKTGYTPLELAVAMSKSPTKKLFQPPKPRPMPRPGLQLGPGQRALVLAGGFLNRVLVKDGVKILPKASPMKEQFIKEQNSKEVYNAKTGEQQEQVTTVFSERIVLRVRVLDEGGVIHDLK